MTHIRLVDLKSQYETISDEVHDAINGVLAESAFIGGRFVKTFEQAFARYCNTDHCVGVGNGTDAIYVALRALGVGRGDEVITAANSFIATAEAITMTGAKVVFVDCDPETYNIDLVKLQQAITSATKAIVPVHLYGRPVNMDSLMDLARAHGLLVIEDAAQAHGGVFNDRRVGSIGDAACFSFYPGKNLGAYGDGGAITTKDPDLALKMRMLANHGRQSKHNHEFEGVNSRLDGLQAAILTVKLNHLEKWTEQRRKNAALYRRYLQDLPLILPNDSEAIRHVYHLFVIRTDDREKVRAFLKKQGVDTGVHYPVPLPFLKAYAHLGYDHGDFPAAHKLCKEILSLPMYPELSEEQIVYICDCIKQYFT